MIQRGFYRNGQLYESVPLRNGRRHGTARTWHKNGVLATEERYQSGLLHGVCRQWDERGRLLGEYRMVHGTGIQRAWHDNRKLRLEISTARGEFCGRNRIWLRYGTLISERFYLHGRVVSAGEYRAAATQDKTLARYRGKPAKLPPNNRTTRKHVHGVFVSALLEKRNRSEAIIWLRKNIGDKAARSLGRFNSATDAAKFVGQLYDAGAVEVVVPDIYRNKAGNQFADGLLVRLPALAGKRKAIRRICAQLCKRRLGAFAPEKDVGESHLFLSLV